MNQKIVCWIGDAPNHRALVAEIAKHFNLAAVVIDRKKANARRKYSNGIISKLVDKFRFRKIDNAWKFLQQHYRNRSTKWPDTPILIVDNINDPHVREFTEQADPALIVVSGTSLIKEPLVSMKVPIGIMNLHTGISPYVKGGPNCTNWCIANNQWGLIGNTVLWISAGIDSGNIITTESIDVSNENSLPAIHLKVMNYAHDLYLRAIHYVLTHRPPHQSIPQNSLGKGTLYLTKMWTSAKKKQLLVNMSSPRNNEIPQGARFIPIPS